MLCCILGRISFGAREDRLFILRNSTWAGIIYNNNSNIIVIYSNNSNIIILGLGFFLYTTCEVDASQKKEIFLPSKPISFC
jgi:hypothetical protein